MAGTGSAAPLGLSFKAAVGRDGDCGLESPWASAVGQGWGAVGSETMEERMKPEGEGCLEMCEGFGTLR